MRPWYCNGRKIFGLLISLDSVPLLTCLAKFSIRNDLGASNLLASLGCAGSRVILGHTLNTEMLMKTDEQKNGPCIMYDFVWGHIHSHPGPQVGPPCRVTLPNDHDSITQEMRFMP